MSEKSEGPRSALLERLFEPVDNSMLAVIRIGFGAVMVWHFGLMLATGVGASIYQDPPLSLPYIGLEWLVRLNEPGMIVCLWVSFIASVLVMLGLFYRYAMGVLVVLLFYLQFQDVTAYSNQDYLAMLYGFWLGLAPAAGRWSLDARRSPAHRSNSTPRWTVWMLRFQVGVAYFFGGLVKFNEDWLAGEPIRTWLQQNAENTVFGAQLASEPVVTAMAWSGLFFDLTIAFWLLIPITRAPAMAAVVLFHLTNEHVFEVGVLPFMMIVVTLVFLPPDFLSRFAKGEPVAEAPSTASPRRRRLVLGLMAVWIVWQSLFPLRHHLYPGDGRWTFEGQRFSWWWRHATVDLDVKMYVEHPDGSREKLSPPDFLSEQQYGVFIDPHTVVRIAHVLKERDYPNEDVKIFADVKASLNKRPEQQLIPVTVDLVREPLKLGHYDWIVPLEARP